MNKKNSKIIFIITICLIASFLYIGYSNKNIKEYKEEIHLLKEKVNLRDATITENQVRLNQNDKINDEINEVNQSLRNEIEIYGELIEEYRSALDELDIRTEYMEFEKNSKLIYSNIFIDFDFTEKRAIELFGEPKEINIGVYGSDGIWYLEGLYNKEIIYDNFTLLFHGDENGENYELIRFTTNSNELYLMKDISIKLNNGVSYSTKEIKVGDSEEDLLNTYPQLIENNWIDQNKNYLYASRWGSQGIYFEIEDEKISKISISVLFH